MKICFKGKHLDLSLEFHARTTESRGLNTAHCKNYQIIFQLLCLFHYCQPLNFDDISMIAQSFLSLLSLLLLSALARGSNDSARFARATIREGFF